MEILLVALLMAAPVPPDPVKPGFRWVDLSGQVREVREVRPDGRVLVRFDDCGDQVEYVTTRTDVWRSTSWHRQATEAAVCGAALAGVAASEQAWGHGTLVWPPEAFDRVWPILPPARRGVP